MMQKRTCAGLVQQHFPGSAVRGTSAAALLHHRQRRRTLRCRCSPPDPGSVTTSPGAAASPAGAASNGTAAASPPQQHVECVATGMDVQCFLADDEPQAAPVQRQQPDLQAAVASSSGQVDCIATGLDVQCFVGAEEAPPGQPAASTSSTKQQEQQQQQQQQQPAAAPAPPRTAAAAAASGEGGPLVQLLSAALLVSPFFFWGTSMVAMKPVTAHTTPLLLGAIRLLPAGLALLGWAAATGRPLLPATPTAWAWVAAFALVDGAAFQGFLAEGLQRTSAGLGSVIIDSQPLSVALLAALLFGEALSPLGIAGLFVGVAGLLLLEVPPELLLGSAGAALEGGGGDGGLGTALQAGLQEGLGTAAATTTAAAAAGAGGAGGGGWSLTSSGEFWMLLAAQSMAVGTVMVRWVSKHCDPVAATAWHMVLGGIILAAAALAADGGSGELSARLSLFSASDAAAMAYVSLFGGAASYGIFFYEATHGSLTAISSLTFLTPVFAAGAGYLALGETLTPLQLAGAVVTLSAVFAINTPASHAGGSGSSSSSSGEGGAAAAAAATAPPDKDA